MILFSKDDCENFNEGNGNSVQKGKMNNGQDGEHKDNESGSEAEESDEDGDENSTERNNKSNGENSGRSGVRNNNGGNGNSDENEMSNSEDGDEDGDKDGDEDGNEDGDEKGNKDGDREGRGIAVGNRNDEAGRNDEISSAGNTVAKAGKKNAARENEIQWDKLIKIWIYYCTWQDVLNQFSGDTCARKWITQVKNIASIYGVNEPFMKMLIVSKIKGKACMCLHARVLLPTEQLVSELISMFGEKSKLEARRKFEDRKWTAGESFVAYADDKVMMAHGINMDEEELLGLLIEGIPNQMLRIQARIQCFADVRHIKRAFAEVKLPKVYEADRKAASVEKNSSTLSRCFNCNSKGHWAKECKKPKGEKGSCYACGEMGHFVATCLKNKNGEGNNYVRNFEINFMNYSKTKCITACLIDTGSPISFIKIS